MSSKKSWKVILFSLLFMNHMMTAAAEISYTRKSPWGNADLNKELILIQGEIVNGDYEKLLRLIKDDVDRFRNFRAIVIASPGGDLEEALKIASFVHGSFSQVLVGDTYGKCISACFFIIAAAPERAWTNGYLGIHRPYFSDETVNAMGARQVEQYQSRIFTEARRFLTSVDVPTNLIDKMFATSSLDVFWLGEPGREITRLRPSYEQLLISRCGYKPAIHRRAIDDQDPIAKEELVKSLNCGARLSQVEAANFIQRIIKK